MLGDSKAIKRPSTDLMGTELFTERESTGVEAEVPLPDRHPQLTSDFHGKELSRETLI